ncbi:MAG TPA: exopolyphosphatase [Arenimonas sp.]|uniref:exopolyphosphatase n=1 Tax=Arenimonas sp. TaxID=1872635 RepID=UPI002BE120F4|nr:exopolyphosphatase [Arenimonas sp.]HMB57110.1 exopolyphosphatase [Arenimonas sp.]
MPVAANPPLQDGDLLAAVDIGSNSFHMVVARYVLGQLRIVDRIKEHVRLAEGLDGKGGLSDDALMRALDCLSRFGQRLATIPPQRVRAIATNTVRQLSHPHNFLMPAEASLGHDIEVVAGREEARLIYLGVAHGNPPRNKRRLVIDIGGGSTEFIIGAGFEALERESLQMGCIATTRRFFADGKLSKKRWKEAQTEITAEFQQFVSTYRSVGWQEIFGSSGTIKAIGEIATSMKLTRGAITEAALATIRDKLLEFDRIEDIRLPGLSADRRPVIAGGLLILDAAFAELDLKRMQVSDDALREGVLYDIVGRGGERDPRDASILALCARYGVDKDQAQHVETTALALFDQVAESWQLDADDRQMLAWAARIHEIGLVIAHSQYHQHGAYLIEHSDIAGFSKTEQQFIAALVRNQRRGVHRPSVDSLPDRLGRSALNCALLLRLSVLLHRSHDRDDIPRVALKGRSTGMELTLSQHWLEAHPLTQADLDSEREHLKDVGLSLEVASG